MSEVQAMTEKKWFYEEEGQRKGPVSESEMVEFMASSVISHGTSVWKQGFPDWLKVENTDLRIYLGNAPPPLAGKDIDNSLVWMLAFAPLIGYLIEKVVARVIHDSEYAATAAMENSEYWLITVVLNIVLAFSDVGKLKNAGLNTEKFDGNALFAPFYLYQRAKATKQNLAYFVVWIVSFVIYASQNPHFVAYMFHE